MVRLRRTYIRILRNGKNIVFYQIIICTNIMNVEVCENGWKNHEYKKVSHPRKTAGMILMELGASIQCNK